MIEYLITSVITMLISLFVLGIFKEKVEYAFQSSFFDYGEIVAVVVVSSFAWFLSIPVLIIGIIGYYIHKLGKKLGEKYGKREL